MANITKRGPYQWRVLIRHRGFPSQSKTFNTKVEAEAWAKMIESEMSRGVWLSRSEAESTTLHDALLRYEREITASKKGSVQEKSVIKLCMSTELAKRFLASIRSADVAALRDEWLKDCKPATVLRRLAVLSHVFNIARKEWGMESLLNPVELVRKPQPNNARTRRLAVCSSLPRRRDDVKSSRRAKDGELERVSAASESSLLPSIIQFAVETAMRRGEIVDLRWEHVNLKARVAHLPTTKNGAARNVPLSPRAIAILKPLKAAHDKEAEAAEEGDTGRVFGISGDAVTRAFERAVVRARRLYAQECKEAESRPDDHFLADLRFHDLRHEATSRLASIFPLHELAKITGHKDPRMLMRYYHPRAEDLAKRLA
ncbi:site-specific integrase [Solimonas variicoloris]|uniref:site-specific integrase n=1 Tax=Solimonas variicoloris TaxID=254408 RepID=UPI00039FD99A|nr:site-specific integrase [Solimonas variicoloris]